MKATLLLAACGSVPAYTVGPSVSPTPPLALTHSLPPSLSPAHSLSLSHSLSLPAAIVSLHSSLPPSLCPIYPLRSRRTRALPASRPPPPPSRNLILAPSSVRPRTCKRIRKKKEEGEGEPNGGERVLSIHSVTKKTNEQYTLSVAHFQLHMHRATRTVSKTAHSFRIDDTQIHFNRVREIGRAEKAIAIPLRMHVM